jgi:hypothetical protein
MASLICGGIINSEHSLVPSTGSSNTDDLLETMRTMDLYTFTSRLTDDGLATFMYSRDSDWMKVGLPWQPPSDDCGAYTAEVAGRCVVMRKMHWPDRDVWAADPAAVYAGGNRWSFTNEGLPQFGGIDVEEVQCYRDSLDEMYKLVWNYYFRERVLVQGWRVPLYQHPSWRLQEIEKAIASATIKSTSEVIESFRRDREAWDDRPPRRVGRPDSADYQILPTMDDLLHYTIEDPSRPTRRLHLRYDCKEAFIEEVSEHRTSGIWSQADARY